MDYRQILNNYNDILQPEDIQEILKVGRNTVYHYLSTGEIKSHKIAGKYRIPKLYLLEFIYPDKDFFNEPFSDISRSNSEDPVLKEVL